MIKYGKIIATIRKGSANSSLVIENNIWQLEAIVSLILRCIDHSMNVKCLVSFLRIEFPMLLLLLLFC